MVSFTYSFQDTLDDAIYSLSGVVVHFKVEGLLIDLIAEQGVEEDQSRVFLKALVRNMHLHFVLFRL